MSYLETYRRYIPHMLFAVVLTVTMGVWALVLVQTPSGRLKVVMMDVGQGDAIYIESPTGVQVVVDGGPDNTILRTLPKAMPLFDRSIDVLIETHPHADHITGFVDLLKRYQVGAFLEPGVVYQGLGVETLEKEILQSHVPRYIAKRGMVIDIGGGATLDVLYPEQDATYLPEPRVHQGNVVARLVFGSTSMLLMGDAPEDVEQKLLILDGDKLKSDLLKVGHHGSKTSSSQRFLAIVQPKEALISVGVHNSYHHPTQETLARLGSVGSTILRTDQEGSIQFESDGTIFARIK